MITLGVCLAEQRREQLPDVAPDDGQPQDRHRQPLLRPHAGETSREQFRVGKILTSLVPRALSSVTRC